MPNPFKNIFDRAIGYIGYIPLSKQITVVNSEIADQKQGSNLVKAVVAKVYESFRKVTQKRNYSLEYPDVKLTTIKAALKVEGYFRRAKDRYIEMIWRNGYDFIGKNKRAVKYVKRRFEEIAYITQKPTNVLFEEICEQLVPLYNCFIYKVRKEGSSSGRQRKYFGKKVNPVAGYFILDPTRVRVKTDNNTGKIIGYEYVDEAWQVVEIRNIDWRDLVHIAIDKAPGAFYGEPAAATILDDIRALRRMEENVEILVFQHTIPLYHYKIGSPEKPTQPGEVETTRTEVESMLTQGMLITPDRHDITAIGVQREALNVENYLEYFKARILTGLGHSTTSLGEGGGVSRATASVLEKAVLDAARRFQKVIKTYMDDFLIQELLLEGGFDIFDDEQRVELFIPEIDLDSKIRKEFHTLQLYQGNLLTEDEARKDMGRDSMTAGDRKKTYFELVVKPRALILAVDEPWLATGGGKKSTGGAAGNTGGSGANREAPQNQQGVKKVGTTARTQGADSEIIDDISKDANGIMQEYETKFIGEYDAVLEDILEMIKEDSFNSGKISLGLSKQFVIDEGSKQIIAAYKAGVELAGFNVLIPVEADLKLMHTLNIKAIDSFYIDLVDRITNSDKTEKDVLNVFESQKYRIGFIVDWFIKKSYWLGIASSLGAQGHDSVLVKCVNSDSNDICHSYSKKVNLKKFSLDQIPPYHSKCECSLELQN